MSYSCDECGHDKKMCSCVEGGDTAYGYGPVVSALDHQEGGNHYKTKPIQPAEYCMANGISFMEGSVIKYVTRWRDKGGVQDLKKARHFLDMLIEWEQRNDGPEKV